MSRQPAIVETVNERGAELSETLADLREFEITIKELETRVEEMSEAERKSFYESVTTLRQQALNVNTPGELLELQEEVAEAVRSPLQQAAQEALDQFLSELQLELSDQERTETVDSFESLSPDGLKKFATTYQGLTETAQELKETPHDVYAEWVAANPGHLQDPQGLQSRLTELDRRQTTLERLEAAFADAADHIPALDFTTVAGFYQDVAMAIGPISPVIDNIDDIETTVEVIENQGITAQTAVREEFESWYESEELTELPDTVTSIVEDLESAERASRRAVDLTARLEEYHDTSGTHQAAVGPETYSEDSMEDPFAPKIETVVERKEQLQSYRFKSTSYMIDEIEELEESADRIVDTLYERLSTLREFIDALETGGDMPTAPTRNIEKSPLQIKHVHDSPAVALEEFHTLQEWITDHLETELVAGEQKMLIDMWQSLTAGDPVDITEENKEAILLLADRLPLSVVISD